MKRLKTRKVPKKLLIENAQQRLDDLQKEKEMLQKGNRSPTKGKIKVTINERQRFKESILKDAKLNLLGAPAKPKPKKDPPSAPKESSLEDSKEKK
mmetsp:Transcript_13578/g.21198  ORF Transcript_13578/g.21198 Transcript_13578/m.21198 type:complete len:96 (+) Transcript_13578:1174-1461(+)